MIKDGTITPFLFLIVIFVFVFATYYAAKKGKKFSIKKKIAAFDAIPEAIGRATEMGRPMHSTSGGSRTESWRGPHVVAGLTLIAYVAEMAARIDIPFYLSVNYPDQIVVGDETLRSAYLKAGHPERYKREYVLYHGDTDSSYSGGMMGFMMRNNVGANFMLGGFGSESLLLAETGNRLGAMQIAGTPTTWQLPFLVTTCDYVMMGDEVYAAGCLVTGDPIETSFVISQDYLKIISIALIILGTIISTLGSNFLVQLMKM